MSSAPRATIAPRGTFADYIKNRYPGGRHVVDHIHDGPFHAVVIDPSSLDRADGAAREALDHFASYNVRFFDGEFGHEDALLVLCSQFGAELLQAGARSDRFLNVVTYRHFDTFGPFETLACEADLGRALVEIYFGDLEDAELHAVADEVLAVPGALPRLLTFLNDYDADELLDLALDPDDGGPARLLRAFAAAVA